MTDIKESDLINNTTIAGLCSQACDSFFEVFPDLTKLSNRQNLLVNELLEHNIKKYLQRNNRTIINPKHNKGD